MLNNPIIFIGTGRSGSTVISGAIFSHKDFAFPSNYQQKLPWSLSVNLLRRLFDNPFWRVFTRGGKNGTLHKLIFLPSEAYAMWRYLTAPRIDFSRGFLLEDRATPEEAARIRAYFEQMVRLQGKKRLAFKITGPARIGYLLSIFPDARFVYIKRRLVPTLNSFLKTSFWESRGKHQLWFTGAYNTQELNWADYNKANELAMTAFQLGRVTAATEYEWHRHQADVIAYNYEDFTSKPEAILRQITDKLQLPDDNACLDYIAQNPIYQSNKKDEDYFSPAELETIYASFKLGKTFSRDV